MHHERCLREPTTIQRRRRDCTKAVSFHCAVVFELDSQVFLVTLPMSAFSCQRTARGAVPTASRAGNLFRLDDPSFHPFRLDRFVLYHKIRPAAENAARISPAAGLNAASRTMRLSMLTYPSQSVALTQICDMGRRKHQGLRRTESASSAGADRLASPRGQSLCGRRDCADAAQARRRGHGRHSDPAHAPADSGTGTTHGCWSAHFRQGGGKHESGSPCPRPRNFSVTPPLSQTVQGCISFAHPVPSQSGQIHQRHLPVPVP